MYLRGRGSSDASEECEMTVVPVEYVVISFPGNQFRGEIVPAIRQLVDEGIVRVLDLAFVRKDANGNVTTFEYDELEGFRNIASTTNPVEGLFTDEELAELGERLDPSSSAALLLWEDSWASRLATAIHDAG